MKTNIAWYIQQLVDVTEEAMLIDQDNDHVIICWSQLFMLGNMLP